MYYALLCSAEEGCVPMAVECTVGAFKVPQESPFSELAPLPVNVLQRVVRAEDVLSVVSQNRDGDGVRRDGDMYQFKFRVQKEGEKGKTKFGELPLLYWGRACSERDQDKVKLATGEADTDVLAPPFQITTSRYGSFKFSVSVTDLLREYKRTVIGGGDVAMFVLGSQVFTREHVHTVLVCRDGDERAAGLLKLWPATAGTSSGDGSGPRPLLVHSLDDLSWVLFSTGLDATDSRTWEQLEFAFLGNERSDEAWRVPTSIMDVSIVTRVRPWVPRVLHVGRKVEPEEGAYEFLLTILEAVMPSGRPVLPIILPASFYVTYVTCFALAQDNLAKQIAKETGVVWARGRNLVAEHFPEVTGAPRDVRGLTLMLLLQRKRYVTFSDE